MGKNKYNNDYERMINNATYRRLIPGLIKDHEGGWIVISKGELIGIYKTRLDAIHAIKTHDSSKIAILYLLLLHKKEK